MHDCDCDAVTGDELEFDMVKDYSMLIEPVAVLAVTGNMCNR